MEAESDGEKLPTASLVAHRDLSSKNCANNNKRGMDGGIGGGGINFEHDLFKN